MTPPTSAPGDHTPVRDTADEPVSVPAQPESHAFSIGYSVQASAPPLSGGPASGPRSGEQIRNLRDWIEQNRDNLNLGSYRLVRLIGTGAFGRVWEAEHTVSGARVAIKFLAASDQSWEKMLEEVQRLEDLKRTPGNVSVFDVSRGSADLPPYYVMTLASGSLGDRLKQLKKAGAPAGGPLVPVADATQGLWTDRGTCTLSPQCCTSC